MADIRELHKALIITIDFVFNLTFQKLYALFTKHNFNVKVENAVLLDHQ